MSPARSAIAVLGGVVVYWILLSLFMGITVSMLPSLFPREEGATLPTGGLAAILLGELVNGLVAGLLTARIAGRAPLAHTAALAGLLGLYAMTSMDQVRGMPGWFALGFACMGPLAVMIGGAVAGRVIAARAASK
jgi:hypothetical protein